MIAAPVGCAWSPAYTLSAVAQASSEQSFDTCLRAFIRRSLETQYSGFVRRTERENAAYDVNNSHTDSGRFDLDEMTDDIFSEALETVYFQVLVPKKRSHELLGRQVSEVEVVFPHWRAWTVRLIKWRVVDLLRRNPAGRFRLDLADGPHLEAASPRLRLGVRLSAPRDPEDVADLEIEARIGDRRVGSVRCGSDGRADLAFDLVPKDRGRVLTVVCRDPRVPESRQPDPLVLPLDATTNEVHAPCAGAARFEPREAAALANILELGADGPMPGPSHGARSERLARLLESAVADRPEGHVWRCVAACWAGMLRQAEDWIDLWCMFQRMVRPSKGPRIDLPEGDDPNDVAKRLCAAGSVDLSRLRGRILRQMGVA